MTAPASADLSGSRRQARPAELRASRPTSASGRLAIGDYGVPGDGTLRITPISSPPGLAITGEIDEATYGDLVGPLETLTARPGEIHVDLAEVKYCDLAGLRAIVGLTGANGQNHSSRRVLLHNVPPHMRTVLGILGWDCTPGLTMDELKPA
jgi:ABC-type transporter Mla MlaB component